MSPPPGQRSVPPTHPTGNTQPMRATPITEGMSDDSDVLARVAQLERDKAELAQRVAALEATVDQLQQAQSLPRRPRQPCQAFEVSMIPKPIGSGREPGP